MALNLSIYQIIRGPVLSDKASKLNLKQKKLVIEVHPQATKIEVKQALESLFQVKVKKINSLCRKGKVRQVRRISHQQPLRKHVVVTLRDGYSIDLFDQPSPAQV